MTFPNNRFRIRKAGAAPDGKIRWVKSNDHRYWATWLGKDGTHISVWWYPDGTRWAIFWNEKDGVVKKEFRPRKKSWRE